MLNRKDAVSMAVAALLASAGFAFGEDAAPVAPSLSLDRQALHLDDAAPVPLLTQGLTAIGVQPTLDKYGISIGGYIDSGYAYNLRHKSGTPADSPEIEQDAGGGHGAGAASFNPEVGNHYTLDQIDFAVTRTVDPSKGKFDIGGEVEVLYGEDAAAIHSNGLEYGNYDFDSEHNGTGDRYHPQYQFDIEQAFVDVAIPVGSGLKVRIGKADTLIGYEVINPNGNPFYSHSNIFTVEPLTQTGIIGFYTINSQFSVAAGVTRGWDQALKDNNGSPDGVFQVVWTINKQWTASLQGTIGSEDTDDESHWRIAPDLVVTYAMNDNWSFAFEGIYFYDGGYNNLAGNTNNTLPVDAGDAGGEPIGSYGDVWGGAFYASYKVNQYFTVNFRGEKLHDYRGDTTESSGPGDTSAQNWYEGTLGVTITPLPTNKYLSGVKLRPEVRYDYADGNTASGGHAFTVGSNSSFKDQWTAAFDLIVNY